MQSLRHKIGATPTVLGAYAVALIFGGHGAVPMFMGIFWGVKALFVPGGESVWIVSAIAGVPSIVYLLVLASRRQAPGGSARARRVPLIGLYLSWLLPAVKVASGEGAGFIATFPTEIIASLPFQIAIAVALYNSLDTHSAAEQ